MHENCRCLALPGRGKPLPCVCARPSPNSLIALAALGSHQRVHRVLRRDEEVQREPSLRQGDERPQRHIGGQAAAAPAGHHEAEDGGGHRQCSGDDQPPAASARGVRRSSPGVEVRQLMRAESMPACLLGGHPEHRGAVAGHSQRQAVLGGRVEVAGEAYEAQAREELHHREEAHPEREDALGVAPGPDS